DDLYVKALLLDDGERKVLLVTLDILFHDYAFRERLAEYAQRRHGIAPECLVVSYTHTHAGPAVAAYDIGQVSAEYEEFLWERSKACIDRVMTNVFEGAIAYGAVEGDWSMSRRAVVNGKRINAPNPAGPTDRVLHILRIADLGGKARALLLNYACHPVTTGDRLYFSAEYPGRLCQLLEARNYGATALFFQGGGGTSRPRVAAATTTSWKNCTFDEMDGMASDMAKAVQQAMDSGKAAPLALSLAAAQFALDLDLNVRPRAWFEEQLKRENFEQTRLRLRYILDQYDLLGDKVRLRGGVIRLSPDVYVAWLTGEVCLEVKQEIEKVFAGKKLIFIGYGDDTAYVPEDKLLDEGGYEPAESVVEFRLKGPFGKGVNAKLRRAYGDALRAVAP
ncbi:MAG TPA: hypothetical protein P5137_10660, partial [Candidatus Brocadiia bacterium]|nr:hypothetical protein [Candidatus Brocadiia bacterium]